MTKTDRVNYVRSWREKNREEQRDYFVKYRKKNKKKLLKQQAAYRARHKNSPEFKLRKNLRERLRAALKGLAKSKGTMTLLGCTVEELKQHLQRQFKSGMSWGNYGEWHIDHIKPVSSFDLIQPEQQLICFHFSNLQPLWASENLSKGNRLTI